MFNVLLSITHRYDFILLLCLNSVSFKGNAVYWIGATDEVFEGDFRWTNGFPYTFSNWFPGWSEHNNYNKQPNDDGKWLCKR